MENVSKDILQRMMVKLARWDWSVNNESAAVSKSSEWFSLFLNENLRESAKSSFNFMIGPLR